MRVMLLVGTAMSETWEQSGAGLSYGEYGPSLTQLDAVTTELDRLRTDLSGLPFVGRS